MTRVAAHASSVALVGALLLARPASAQDARAESVLAFDQAEALMAGGKISDACPRYAESYRLDPQLGTLLHLADCLEQNGQTASAWARFRDAAELAERKSDARRELAEQRVQQLLPRLSRLRIDVPPGFDAQIVRDGVPLGRTFWGTDFPVDPGEHSVAANAPGRRGWQTKVTVPADGRVTLVKVPVLESDASPKAEPPRRRAASTATANPSVPDERHTGFLEARWPALAAATLGVAGTAVGSIFGLRSMKKKEDAGDHCDGNVCRDQTGLTLKQEAIDAGNVSTIGFIVGGVGLAGAATLWFVLPSGDERTSDVARRTRRVTLAPGAIRWEQTW